VINPYQVVDLASPVAGVIESLYVERSQAVKAGQVVAQLEADVERANVELARFRASIRSEIKLSQVNMEFDSLRQQRVTSLHQQKAISIDTSDEARREAGLSRWKLEQAKEQSTIRRLEQVRAEQQLNQKSIRAPFDGFVLDTFKYPGEYVEDKPILRLAQLDPLVIEAIVPMENFGELQAGMLAEVLPEMMPGEKLSAEVTIVDLIGDTASNTFGVRLVMPNPGNKISAGVKCLVKFLQKTPRQLAAVNSQSNEKEIISTVQNASPVEINKAIKPDVAKPAVVHQIANKEIHNEIQKVSLMVDKKPSSYLVMIEQGETSQQTRERLRLLQSAGVDDYLEMDHGPYKNMILLGLYNRRNPAELRQQSINQLGIEAFIRERY